MQLRTVLVFSSGLVAGVGAALMIAASVAPKLMLRERLSPYGLVETVERITNSAVGRGWVVSGVISLDESVRAHGAGDVRPVRLIKLCHPQYAARILRDERARIVSVMMPCTIAVYEKADGRVAVATMNAGLVGRFFGGIVAEVMAGPVSREQQEFVSFCGQ